MSGTCFTYYWANPEWEKYEQRGEEGKPLLYIGGSKFDTSGIRVGDFVYVFGEISAQLYLCGRMKVCFMGIEEDTQDFLGKATPILYPADQYCASESKVTTPKRFRRMLSEEVVRQLRFISKTSPSLKYEFGQLVRQQMRSIRKLTPESAGLLDKVIGVPRPI